MDNGVRRVEKVHNTIISNISSKTPELAIAASPFSHRGKRAPLIWLENGQVTEPIYNFLAVIKPTFKNDPINDF